MRHKYLFALQGLFLLLIGVSAFHYRQIGIWKDYVALFGEVELFLFLAAMLVFLWAWKKQRPSKLLLLADGLFCVLQTPPFVMAAYMGRYDLLYAAYAVFHLAVVIFGLYIIRLYGKDEVLCAWRESPSLIEQFVCTALQKIESKGAITVSKAVFALVVTFFFAFIADVLGNNILGLLPMLGPITAIVIIGAFIIYYRAKD